MKAAEATHRSSSDRVHQSGLVLSKSVCEVFPSWGVSTGLERVKNRRKRQRTQTSNAINAMKFRRLRRCHTGKLDRLKRPSTLSQSPFLHCKVSDQRKLAPPPTNSANELALGKRITAVGSRVETSKRTPVQPVTILGVPLFVAAARWFPWHVGSGGTLVPAKLDTYSFEDNYVIHKDFINPASRS